MNVDDLIILLLYDLTRPRGLQGSEGEGISEWSVMLVSYEQGAKGNKGVSCGTLRAFQP
jgi:hypothetical protein